MGIETSYAEANTWLDNEPISATIRVSDNAGIHPDILTIRIRDWQEKTALEQRFPAGKQTLALPSSHPGWFGITLSVLKSQKSPFFCPQDSHISEGQCSPSEWRLSYGLSGPLGASASQFSSAYGLTYSLPIRLSTIPVSSSHLMIADIAPITGNCTSSNHDYAFFTLASLGFRHDSRYLQFVAAGGNVATVSRDVMKYYTVYVGRIGYSLPWNGNRVQAPTRIY